MTNILTRAQIDEEAKKFAVNRPVALPGLPSIQDTGATPAPTTEPTLPQASDTGSLVGFKDNMARVMTLAEAKRNDLLKQFMMPFKGTMQASDFTSLFDNFANQSDLSNKTMLEKLIPKPDTQIITETDASGRTTAVTIDKNTGKVVNKTDLGVIGKATPLTTLTVNDKQTLFDVDFSQPDIVNIEKDVNQYGLQKVLEGISDSKQKIAIQKVYGGEEKFITKEFLNTQFSTVDINSMLKSLGKSRSDYTNFWQSSTAEEKNIKADFQKYTDGLMPIIEQYRKAGYTDKEILKLME